MKKVVCSTTGEVFTSYKEYLRSDHWSNIRDLYRSTPHCKDKCHICGASADHMTRMHIHHRSYVNIGRELPQDLVELCERCHKEVHIVVKSKTVKMADICFAVEYLKHKWKLAHSKKYAKKKAVKLLRVV